MQPIAEHILKHLRSHCDYHCVEDSHGCDIEISSPKDNAIILIDPDSGWILLGTSKDHQYRLHLSDPNLLTTITNHLAADL